MLGKEKALAVFWRREKLMKFKPVSTMLQKKTLNQLLGKPELAHRVWRQTENEVLREQLREIFRIGNVPKKQREETAKKLFSGASIVPEVAEKMIRARWFRKGINFALKYGEKDIKKSGKRYFELYGHLKKELVQFLGGELNAAFASQDMLSEIAKQQKIREQETGKELPILVKYNLEHWGGLLEVSIKQTPKGWAIATKEMEKEAQQ